MVGIRKDLPNTYKYPLPSKHKLVLRDVLQDVPRSEGAKYPENKRKILELVPPGGVGGISLMILLKSIWLVVIF